tara:strand:+ start:362 stop:595 length:234 start_codon:yes stop_codon:yes gene_type:complete
MEVKKIDKVNVEFYITSKRKLRFNLQLQKMDFEDWVERQLDCDKIEQKILNYYDANAEEIDLKLDYKLINYEKTKAI